MNSLSPLARDLLEPATTLHPYATVEDAARLFRRRRGCFMQLDGLWLAVDPRELVGVPHTRRLIETALRPVEPLSVITPVTDTTFSASEARPVLDGAGELAGTVTYRGLLGYRCIVDELVDLRSAVGSLVHDFNNLLTVSRAAVQDEDREQSLAALDELGGMVRRLSALQRSDEGPRSFDLGSFLRDAAVQLSTLTQLRIEARSKIARVCARPGILRRVLLNLCLNAAESGARNVRFETTVSPPSLVLSVIDDGPGFTAETAAQAFEPGYSTTGGTGLGLPTVARLVEGLRGTVHVEAEPGRGRVDLMLPIELESARAPWSPEQRQA